jgi:hypothetical protein
MSLISSFEQLSTLAEKRDEKVFGFIKQVLLMASSLLGILVSLHKTSSEIRFSRLSFSFSVGLLALGILLLIIALSAEVAKHRSMFLKRKAEVSTQLSDESYRPKMIFGNPSKIYRFCETFGYISLSLSIISLAVYAVLIS